MKNLLRKDLIKKRKNVSKSEIYNKSQLIEKNLFRMYEFKSSKKILFYISYDNEVYTHDMIKKSISINKKIIVPISDVIKKNLILSTLQAYGTLTRKELSEKTNISLLGVWNHIKQINHKLPGLIDIKKKNNKRISYSLSLDLLMRYLKMISNEVRR